MSSSVFVSIIVISYNSDNTIIDTLNSIKSQSFKNYEIIISDDSSMDNTINVCNLWKTSNQNIEVKILTSIKNCGIPQNINKALPICKGKYIKIIAADDILLANCLSDNVMFSEKHNSYAVFSNMLTFKKVDQNNSIIPISKLDFKNNIFVSNSIKAKDQYQILLRRCIIPAPTVFLRKDTFNTIGYFDENYTIIEDWPFWLKMTKSGIKFFYLNKETVAYRISENSVFHKKNDDSIFKSFTFNIRPFLKDYILDNLSFIEKMLIIINQKRQDLLVLLKLDRQNRLCHSINRMTVIPINVMLNFFYNLLISSIKRNENNL